MLILRWVTVILVALGTSLGVAAAVTAETAYTPATPYTLVTMKPGGFTSNGDLINGWYWLRNSSQTAEWTFDVNSLASVMAVRDAKRSSVYLNVSGLVTKGVNGASGYSGGLSIRYVGVKTVNSSIYLNNPFRPRELTQLPINPTGGIGYAAYGASLVPSSSYQGATTMKVIVSRSNSSATQGIHIAVNQNAALIAYVK
jgi:hypothetical protein